MSLFQMTRKAVERPFSGDRKTLPGGSAPRWGARLLAAVCLLALAAGVAQAQELEQLYLRKTGLDQPNAVLVADLVHDEVPEIIVTGVRGNLRVFNSLTGEQMNSKRFSEALSGVAVGDFLGRGTLDIAVGTSTGRLIILDGTTLEEVTDQQAATSISIQPSVVSIPRSGGGTQDAIVILAEDGTIHGLAADAEGRLGEMWRVQTGSRFQAPAAVGPVRVAGRDDIVATTGDGNVFLIDPATGSFEKFLVRQSRAIPVSPLLVDTTADGRMEFIVTIAGGDMYCYEYDGSATPRFRERWMFRTNIDPVSDPVLISRGSDISRLYVLQASESYLILVNAHDGTEVAAERTGRFSGINTHISLIPKPNGFPEVSFGLKKTFQTTVNMAEWISRPGTNLEAAAGTIGESLSNSISVAVPDSNGAVLVSISPQGTLYGFRSPHIVGANDWASSTPWMTRGSTPRHNPILDVAYSRWLRELRRAGEQRAAQWELEIERATAAGDWDAAVRHAEQLSEFDPYNPTYQRLHLTLTLKKHLFAIIAMVVGLLAIVGFGGLKTVQALGRRKLRRRAEAAVAREDFPEAQRCYELLLQRSPNKEAVAVDLAGVYMSQRDYSEGTLGVYKLAWKAIPSETKLLRAYARALLIEPKTDDEAAKVYEQALQTFPEPQLLEYGLGRHHLTKGEYEQAGKRLRAALRGGLATNDVYSALCEVYLATANFSAKALPVFQQQFPSRQQDQEFLQGYLSACIDAKKVDSEVESLCQAVLELNGSYVPAYLHLALIYLQKNQVGAAIEEVRGALRVEPDSASAVGLLAHCYLIQNRRDEEAVQAYRRALTHDSRDRELLRVLAGIYFEQGKFDREALDVYHQSLEQNPGDVSTLRALAQAAQLSGDNNLTIRSVEALMNSGQSNAKLTAQLAQAYIKNSIFEPRTEKVLREALRAEPNNAEYVKALADVLAAQDRTDVDTIAIYEAHLANYKDDIRTGRQLAKAYIKADRYENALSVAQRFLKTTPNDEELQRLNALASLYDNKIDEAVEEYQRILARNPGDKEALVNLALAFGQKHRTDDEARQTYERALGIQPNNDLLLMAMARLKARENDHAEAVEYYKKALKARPDNEQAVVAHIGALLSEQPHILRLRWFLTEVLVSQGHLRDALEQIQHISDNHQGQEANVLKALDRIVEKDPRNIQALLQQGSMLQAMGRSVEAITPLERANELNPGSAEIQERLTETLESMLVKKEETDLRFKLGKIYYMQQEYDQAIGCFQKTAQDYRREAESTKMLGKCFTSKGMLDLALQEYKKLVVDEDTKELLYDLAQRYEGKKDLVGAKTVYRQLFAADIDYKDVKARFEMLSGSTSDPMAFEKTSIVQQMSEKAARRYELLDELGRGAMGIVYRARDKELEEIVALKILPDNMSNNPEAVRRFKIEARNARKLSHPAIVRIHDIGEEMGRKYISMEYVDGSDLKKKIKSSPDFKIPVKESVTFAMNIADALAYAHRLGIVHRDIKPANIMLTSGEDVKVTDFGIAKMMDQTGEGTMIGAVIGTPLYMSPEQVQGIPVDNRADIYAFGIMFYELLNGRPPFTEGDLAYQHMHKEPAVLEELPPQLWAVVAKCLAKKKEDRWESADMIYDALKEILKSGALG